MKKVKVLGGSTSIEVDHEVEMAGKLQGIPIPDEELLDNLGLFMSRQLLSRINFI